MRERSWLRECLLLRLDRSRRGAQRVVYEDLGAVVGPVLLTAVFIPLIMVMALALALAVPGPVREARLLGLVAAQGFRVIDVAHVGVVAVVVVIGAIMPIEWLFVVRPLVGLQTGGHPLNDRLCISDRNPIPVEDRHVEKSAVPRAGEVPSRCP